MKSTIFIDRDGTINQNLPFPNVNRPEKLVLLPRAAEGIKILNDMGCRIIVVTNQAGINNPENDLTIAMHQLVTQRLDQLLWEVAGAKVDDTFCCPHQQSENCGCRKPQTGLFKLAQKRYHDIDFQRSFMIGDRTDDIIAGRSLNMTTILVRTGHGITTEQLQNTTLRADYAVDDFYEAALLIKKL